MNSLNTFHGSVKVLVYGIELVGYSKMSTDAGFVRRAVNTTEQMFRQQFKGAQIVKHFDF